MAQAPRRHAAPSGSASTADPEEIARFTAMADAWWDPDGDFRPLHAINRVRIAYLRDQAAAHFGRDAQAPSPFDGLDLLDIGCGGGLLSEPMRRFGATVTAIDAGERNLRIAAAHAAQGGLDIDFRNTTPEVLADEGRTFDIVLNMEVIEHVPDVEAFLTACCRLVRPGGVMAFSTLNRTAKSLALAKIGAEYVLRWLPTGTHDWRKFIKPSELTAGLRAQGMTVTDLTGMSYRPLGGEWTASRDLDVNYLAFAVKDG